MFRRIRSEFTSGLTEDILTSGILERPLHQNEAIDRVHADLFLRGLATEGPLRLFLGTIASSILGFAMFLYRLPRKLFLSIPSLVLFVVVALVINLATGIEFWAAFLAVLVLVPLLRDWRKAEDALRFILWDVLNMCTLGFASKRYAVGKLESGNWGVAEGPEKAFLLHLRGVHVVFSDKSFEHEAECFIKVTDQSDLEWPEIRARIVEYFGSKNKSKFWETILHDLQPN